MKNATLKLNLGCGWKKIAGYVNVDSRPGCSPDSIVDLEKKLPWKNDEVDEIILDQVLEHVTDQIGLVDECYRILKPEGKLFICCPHVSQFESIGELDHKRVGLSVFSFHYTTNMHAAQRDYYGAAKFHIQKVYLRVHPILQFLANLSVIKYEKFLSRFFGAREIQFTLIKIKES